MSAPEHFKDQLYEFIENIDEPFDVDFLKSNCNIFYEDRWFTSALYELEDDEKIVKLNEYQYLPARILRNRWINEAKNQVKTQPLEPTCIQLPFDLIRQIQDLLSERKELGFLNAEEFIREAVRRLIQPKYPTTFWLKP